MWGLVVICVQSKQEGLSTRSWGVPLFNTRQMFYAVVLCGSVLPCTSFNVDLCSWWFFSVCCKLFLPLVSLCLINSLSMHACQFMLPLFLVNFKQLFFTSP